MDRAYVMKLVQAYQYGYMNRRDFIRRATIALGSVTVVNALLAACVQVPIEQLPPVTADPMAPDDERPDATGVMQEGDLMVGMVEYPDADGEMLTGYIAYPAAMAGPLPAVVVLQEWWGVDEHIKDVTRRIAREGYVVLAPDLYKGVVVTEPSEAMKMVMELDMVEAVSEIQQGVAFLLGHEAAAGPAVGIVGFCMGGMLALQTGLVEENLGAIAAFYGRPLTAEEVASVQAPVLGLYGSADSSIPVDAVRAMEAALVDAGIAHDIQVYEGAPHAFFNDARPSYNEAAAADAWPRLLDWFSVHLGGEDMM